MPTRILLFHSYLSHIWFYFFSPNAVVKQTHVLKCFYQEHNETMPSIGIEPATLRSLARRRNQLSYAAAK